MQFYVLCPFLVAALAQLRRRTAAAWLWAGIAASAIAMGVLAGGSDPTRAYYGTDARIGGLLTGVLLAFVLTPTLSRGNSGRNSTAISSRGALVCGVGGATVLAALVLGADESSRWLYPAGFLACRLATVGLIVAASHPGRASDGLSRPVLRWLGQRSYGIYLWHWPILAVTRPGIDVDWPPWAARAGAVAAACVLGELSYRLVEQPFARPRRAPSPDVATRRVALRWSFVGAVLLGTGLVATMLPSVDPIAASLAVGAQVVSSQSVVTTAAPTTTTAAPAPVEPGVTAVAVPPRPQTRSRGTAEPRPPRPAPPKPAAMQAPAQAAFPTTAHGDSVLLGAAGAMQARFGPNAYIDAKVSRQFNEGVVEARRLRDQGRLGRVVFVHLGTNGPPRAADVDAMMDALAGVEFVRFVNVRVNRKWEAATNQTLADGVARHSGRAQLVDWYGFSAGHLDWFQSDGTHLKGPGAEAFANLLASYLPPPPPPPPPEPTTTTAPPPPPPEPTTTTTVLPVPTTTAPGPESG
jgi:hypothetical protein